MSLIFPIANFGTCRCNCGTRRSPMVCEVRGAEVVSASTWMRFSLSLNDVVAPAVLRAQPSGTFTEKPPAGGWNVTNAWLSGMSPGGFDSVATELGCCSVLGGDVADAGDVTGGLLGAA